MTKTEIRHVFPLWLCVYLASIYIRTACCFNRAGTSEQCVHGGGKDHGGQGEMVEDGAEGHLSGKVGRLASCWWSGNIYLVYNTFCF